MGNSISEVEFIDIFSDNLRDVMKEVGISQKQLAKEARMTQGAISHYLRKERMPSVRAIMNLCYVLDCEYSDLLPDYSLVD